MSLFLQFAELCDALAATTKKLEKRAFIADYLRILPIDDAGRAALWLSGTPFAETDVRVLSIGGALLSKAVAELSGATSQTMSAAYRRYGDFGAAAADLLYGHAPTSATITLADIESALAAIAEARGPAPKLRLLLDLLARATPDEAKYLIKLATGDMRTGVKQSLVEEAIAEAFSAQPTAVRRASMLLGSLPEVVALAAAGRLDQARMKLFHPIGFMLASPVATAEEAMARFTEEIAEQTDLAPGANREGIRAVQLEDKFDGIRAQLHVEPTDSGVSGPNQSARVALYSRNRDDLTESFPDLVEAFTAIGEPAILDGEILAWNPAANRALSFSTLQQRLGRKRVTAEMLRDIPAILIVFDILYRDGALLLEHPLVERRRQLEDFAARWSPATASARTSGQPHLFDQQQATAFPRLILAAAMHLSTGPDASAQLDQAYVDARGHGNEGVMIKSLSSLYQPGRRAQVLSDYTFAVRDPDAGPDDPEAALKNVGKAYSGLTDQEIADLTVYFKAHTLADYGHFRTVEPTVVLEVAFNNVMRSSRHASGFALRFPRILRVRNDKPVAEIDTLRRVEEIYNSQPDKPIDET